MLEERVTQIYQKRAPLRSFYDGFTNILFLQRLFLKFSRKMSFQNSFNQLILKRGSIFAVDLCFRINWPFRKQHQQRTNGGFSSIFKVLESSMKKPRTKLSYSAKSSSEPENE